MNPREHKKKTVCMNPSDMEPMLPDYDREKLAQLSCDIFIAAGQLAGSVPAKSTRLEMVKLVREMNSYYSNLIEGHKTLPRDIERALNRDFSENKNDYRNQLLGMAHFEVEALMEQRVINDPETDIYAKEFFQWLHREFYSRIPNEFHYGKTKSGQSFKILPGEFRDFNVDVGEHTPPDFTALHDFWNKFRSFYASESILETNRLMAVAAAHHRFAWIHPFGDGNGRIARLFSHAALIHCKVDGWGMWTLSRGLARYKNRYFASLANADRRRQHDFDGRGNLTSKGLSEFCIFFLETILDQIRFMSELLDYPNLAKRIERYLQIEALHISKHGEQLARLLKAVCLEGEAPRGRVPEIVGFKPTAAREVIKLGLTEGLLKTPSPKGRLSIAFPHKVVESYFPRLFQDLPADDSS